MAGLVHKWMTASSLDERHTDRPRIIRSCDGGHYAQELRNVANRLRMEAEMDLEQPSRELRYRTLDRLHRSYMLQPRPLKHSQPLRVSSRQLRTGLRMAASLAILLGGAFAVRQYAPDLASFAEGRLAAMLSNHGHATQSPAIAANGGPTLGTGPMEITSGEATRRADAQPGRSTLFSPRIITGSTGDGSTVLPENANADGRHITEDADGEKRQFP